MYMGAITFVQSLVLDLGQDISFTEKEIFLRRLVSKHRIILPSLQGQPWCRRILGGKRSHQLSLREEQFFRSNDINQLSISCAYLINTAWASSNNGGFQNFALRFLRDHNTTLCGSGGFEALNKNAVEKREESFESLSSLDLCQT